MDFFTTFSDGFQATARQASRVTREYGPKFADEMAKTVTERVPQGADTVCAIAYCVSQGLLLLYTLC